MAQIDFLPVATGAGANVDSQGNFVGSGYQTTGFTAGVARSAQTNKVWRQSSFWAAAWAQVLSDALGGADVLDDGNLAALVAAIKTMTAGSGIVVTRNANGTFVRTPDGQGGFIYEAWGIVNAPATGNRSSAIAIAFPVAFPGIPSLRVSGGTYPNGVSADGMSVYAHDISAAGATAALECVVNIGGSGAPGFNNAVPVHWHARY
jgi:hypothetical protein